MKYKFVKHWSGMVLYVHDWHYQEDHVSMCTPNHWRKATDTEAYEIMCKLNKKED